MYKQKMPNHKTKCSFCNESFIYKMYSKHLLNKHIDKLFSDTKNQESLELATKAEKPWFIKPVEINFKTDNNETESLYYIPCCRKFFKKKDMAQKHLNDNPECRTAHSINAKETSEMVKNVVNNNTTINNNISGANPTTNNNTNNNITYNIDLSGNSVPIDALRAVLKEVVISVDSANAYRALYYKKYKKLKQLLIDKNITVYSDVSDIDSYYSGSEFGYESDTDMEKYIERYDVAKENKGIINKHKITTDLSRKALKLKTPEDKLKKLELKKQEEIKQKILQDEFDEKVRREEVKEKIANMKSEIKGLEENIKANNKRLNYTKAHLYDEFPSTTPELYKQEEIECDTKNKKCLALISELNNEINKLSKT